MEYKMGVIGIGHWFKRLEAGLQKVGGIRVVKAVGTKPYEAKAEMLKSLGITNESYYTMGGDGRIPEQFFDGIDVVHISNPNEVHANQAMQALSRGKRTIVEKSYAVNKAEFLAFKKFVKEGNYGKSVYLHLHYVHKMPSISFRRSIKELSEKHGKITGITGTFFEPADAEDARRAGWLLDMRSGGLFMDWIHPFEVAYYTTGAYFGKITNLNLYVTNPSYSDKDPSGLMAEMPLKGKRVAEGATIRVNIAKGVEPNYSRKSMLFNFADGAYAKLDFLGSNNESSENRGVFETGKVVNGVKIPDFSSTTSGRSHSEFFVKDILKLCNGKRAGFSMSQVAKVFGPQWDYQKLSKKQTLIGGAKEVGLFLENGINGL